MRNDFSFEASNIFYIIKKIKKNKNNKIFEKDNFVINLFIM